MTDRPELNENKGSTKEQMMDQLAKDNSRAFLDDVQPAMMQTKIEAQAAWWQTLGKDKPAPAQLSSNEAVKSMAKEGWKVEENRGYSYLTRDSADGKIRETDTYEKHSGTRLSQTFYRFDNKDAMASNKFKQVVDAMFDDDGKTHTRVQISTDQFKNQFEARFNKDGSLASAVERDYDKDTNYYSFRKDGSLYEALTRSGKHSSVTNDQLFNSKGQPRSDYNPLYLYEKMLRPIDNLYRSVREMRRSGGMF